MTNVGAKMSALPEGFVDIDEYIAELEEDPAVKARLDEARVKLYRFELTRLRAIEQAAREAMATLEQVRECGLERRAAYLAVPANVAYSISNLRAALEAK